MIVFFSCLLYICHIVAPNDLVHFRLCYTFHSTDRTLYTHTPALNLYFIQRLYLNTLLNLSVPKAK